LKSFLYCRADSYPLRSHVPPGPFLLVIRNYDHRADIAFNVPAADVALLPAQLLKSDDQWTSLVDLALGDHVLQDQANPARQLKITLKP
jgi:hypothetical protein